MTRTSLEQLNRLIQLFQHLLIRWSFSTTSTFPASLGRQYKGDTLEVEECKSSPNMSQLQDVIRLYSRIYVSDILMCSIRLTKSHPLTNEFLTESDLVLLWSI